ncbi:hypothetical protein [Actinokineospora enzanensis]|uniref:hypothetical protein n=1 Tax=Actinokineospora enzanensis TaxID=155975 RepID=UPI0003639D0B|nr:hypothetical protein [Actinokineospora enzanensis]
MRAAGRPSRARDAENSFTENRIAFELGQATQQAQAARTVAGHSLDATDCRELLSMLGLSARTPDKHTDEAGNGHMVQR